MENYNSNPYPSYSGNNLSSAQQPVQQQQQQPLFQHHQTVHQQPHQAHQQQQIQTTHHQHQAQASNISQNVSQQQQYGQQQYPPQQQPSHQIQIQQQQPIQQQQQFHAQPDHSIQIQQQPPQQQSSTTIQFSTKNMSRQPQTTQSNYNQQQQQQTKKHSRPQGNERSNGHHHSTSAANNHQNMLKEKEDHQTMIGIQAQNLYLFNYLNKLEFLIQESIKERKRDKKQKKKQLWSILKALSKKPSVSKDTETLQYYLGLTQGADEKAIDFIDDSDGERASDSDNETLQNRIIGSKRLQNKEPKENSLLSIFGFQQSAASNGEQSDDKKNASSSDYKSDKEYPVLETTIDKKKRTMTADALDDGDYIKQIESMRSKVLNKIGQDEIEQNGAAVDEDSINEYQISDFIRSEWNNMAKTASKLVIPNAADKYQ